MKIEGTFDLTMHAEPPYDDVDGVTFARASFDKRFHRPLDGKEGTFVLQHNGLMDGGASSLTVTVVPDSATGALKGLSGRMNIRIVDGKHFYDFDYELG